MPWSKLDDNIFEHPKMLRAGEDAANLYVRGLVYCNRYLTDGRIEAEVLPAITRKREAPRLAADLVRVGLWEAHPDGGWTVHDFHEHNPTAAEVAEKRAAIAAKRSEAGKRGGMRSGETRSNEAKRKQGASSVSKQTEANAEQPQPEATKQNASPIPSHPLSEGSKEPLSGAPPAAPTGDPLELTPPKAKAARAKTPKPVKPVKPPAPFTAGEAVAALAAASGGRFVAADGTPWAPGWGANIARHIQRVPDLATWTLVGEWIAAGGGYRGTRGMPWVAGGSFLDAVAQSKAWDDGGRYDLVDERGYPVAPPVACSDANDPWVIAAAKQGIKL
jgi:hypothetical protein